VIHCTKCQNDKPASEFSKKQQGQRRGWCKPCRRQWGRNRYALTQVDHLKRIRGNKRRYAAEAKELVRALKREPCTDCGRSFHWFAMDFDHREGVDKAGDIYRLVQGSHCIETLKAEIAKCDMVCAVCHRLRTARRLGLPD
jgi:hypothetical protein